MNSVLFVVSAADHWTLNDGSLHPTGYWAEELAEPHRLFTEAGWQITIATPDGVAPTIDAGSLTPAAAGGEDRAAAIVAYLDTIGSELDEPRSISDVTVADYDVVFYPGGHGPMEDLAVDAVSGRIMTEALDSGRILGVVCHAPAAMLAAKRADGSWPFTGYRMTGFTDEEETLGGLAPKAKWLVQSRLVELGAVFVAGEAWGEHTEIDRNLYTGQNPASSAALAGEIIAAVTAKSA
ncbi:type 1 glutamine amidotransferase domain-containing protein [Cryobacterium sinapicolor]|uniref:Type 1 glutamine amidotransferase domain-containing protein n=1 Tax=Cryobacterium sinapicolor TaxID=1259236 RepID=A0ABY2JBH4_9MICO|nr:MULTISPECIES: type 1 glutamine amidotransferase domain-containing protein [Cryobacterium]TFC86948.1 type 1 glutamine amidotransferase domain-containing protein [Cryobacterium sp. TMT3-29-2]TFD02308.1 type 1 glutamine amidotransferase domain-containing protein [Cryobacterium sinapicolor]